MRTNTKAKARVTTLTHEGAPAVHLNEDRPAQAELMLRRSVNSCLLWEREFYEDGVEIADRLAKLVPLVKPETVANIASDARNKMHLRHAPLFLAREMCRHKSHVPFVEQTLFNVIQRADELSEFMAMYWQAGRQPILHAARRGIARAFRRFDEYQLAKYNRKTAVKLVDVLRMVRPKPQDEAQAALWGRLRKDTLATPDTWETELSAAKTDKKTAWTRLLTEKRLGGMAILRNLRNCNDAGVPLDLLQKAIKESTFKRVLPFRFIAAAQHASNLEPQLEEAMFRASADFRKLPGLTVFLIDVSGSMDARLSAKSEIKRMDAACGLAMFGRELCENVQVYSFSSDCVIVPARRGFALRDAIVRSQEHSNTLLGSAVQKICKDLKSMDRLVVITDEQSHDALPTTTSLGIKNGYVINVASARNGVGYGSWHHIDGWSENVLPFIAELEIGE